MSIRPSPHGTSTGVKVWAERGSTVDYSQTTLANQPANTATEATLGNKPAVKFDGSNDALATTSQFGNVATNVAYTLFMAFSIDALSLNDATTYNNHCLYGDAGGFFGVYAKTGGGTPKVMLYNWDGSDDHVDLTIATGTGYIYSARHDSGSIYAGLGLTAPSSAVSGPTTTTSHPMNLGYRGATPAKWTDCNIGHLVMYNSVLTAPQRERAISKLKVFYSL